MQTILNFKNIILTLLFGLLQNFLMLRKQALSIAYLSITKQKKLSVNTLKKTTVKV